MNFTNPSGTYFKISIFVYWFSNKDIISFTANQESVGWIVIYSWFSRDNVNIPPYIIFKLRIIKI